jgi:hypothetical protein
MGHHVPTAALSNLLITQPVIPAHYLLLCSSFLLCNKLHESIEVILNTYTPHFSNFSGVTL